MVNGYYINLRAPGKIFLAGEYAVLDGAPALIAAVPPWASYRGLPRPRRVRARYPGAAPVSADDGIVDTTAFFQGEAKMGFGSSAAAAVLMAASARGDGRLGNLWASAHAAHGSLVGGGGSGGDIAAILNGGVGLFRRVGDDHGWQAVAFPAGAALVAVALGAPSNTRDWVGRYRAMAADVRSNWVSRVTQAVSAFAQPGADWAAAFQGAAAVYDELAGWLGDDLLPPAFRALAAAAGAAGLTAKPSGAGGGDMAVVYAADAPARREAATIAQRLGLHARVLHPCALGLHRVWQPTA